MQRHAGSHAMEVGIREIHMAGMFRQASKYFTAKTMSNIILVQRAFD